MATQKYIPDSESPSAASETWDYVDAVVFEVLEGIGLAHVRTADGRVCGLNRKTEGIEFSKLRDRFLLRCKVARKFNRVLHAELIG